MLFFSYVSLVLVCLVFCLNDNNLIQAQVNVVSKSVLVIVPSQVFLRLSGGKMVQVGTYFDELMIPLLTLQQSTNISFSYTFASPQGNGVTIDPRSNSSSSFPSLNDYNQAIQLFNKLDVSTKTNYLTDFALETSNKYTDGSDINTDALAKFDLLFIPGGHAPLIDLWSSTSLGRILNFFMSRKKIIASICHGPISFASSSLLGDFLFKGFNLTVFTKAEEQFNELSWGASLSYYPDAVLTSLGGKVIESGVYTPHVVLDRNVLTGQNPQSAPLLGQTLLNLIYNYQSN